jgi:DHA3 family macrolide efflux protein-like MFS transporter
MYDVSLLRSNRPFRVFWVAEVAETVASGLNSIALPWFILTVTGDPLQLGLSFALRSAPDVVLSPLIGGIIDRHSRTRLMAAGHVGTAALTAVLPVFFLAGRLSVVHIYGVMLGLSVTRSLTHNASRAALPALVDDADLDAANSLLMGTRTGGRLVFLLIGGGLTVVFGAAAVLLGAVGGSLLAAFVFLASAVETGRVEGDASLRGYVANFRAGLGTVRSTTVLLQLLVFGVCYNFLVVPYNSVVLPAAARTAFDSAGALTVLLACWRGGAFLGNAVAGRWEATPRTKMVAGTATVGTGTLLAAGALLVAPVSAEPSGEVMSLTAVAVPLLAAGIGQPLFNVPGSSVLQSVAPREVRGTVVTVQNSLLQASFPVPLVLAGILLDPLSPGLLLGGAGVGLLALTVAVGAFFAGRSAPAGLSAG